MTSSVRLVVVLCVLAIARGAAQQPAAPAGQPTFRTSATLVEFTVVATNSRGEPVTDLKQNELSVTDSGKPRDIAFFRFEGAAENNAAAARMGADGLTPGIFTNRSEYTPGPPRNIIALVIDSLNTRPA